MLSRLSQKHIRVVLQLSQASPLWSRVPTRTPDGEPAVDFMMLIKNLNKSPIIEQQQLLNKIQSVLLPYAELILLADLNMKMNLLWISHIPRPQLGCEIAAQIYHVCPSARLISHRMI